MSESKVTGVKRMKGVAGVGVIVVIMVGIAVAVVSLTAASSAPPLPLAYGFGGSSGWQHGSVKPRSIDFGAGGSLFVRGLRWTEWTQTTATGHGLSWTDSCRPNCASGSYVKSRAIMTLSGIKVHAGLRYFSAMTMRWTAHGQNYRFVFHWSPGAVNGAGPFWR
jgi:hypothetical protein